MKKPLPSSEVSWPKRVVTPADAVRFIDGVGFCLLFPIRNLPLPSLYYAMSHRAHADWDRTAKKIWEWKDELGQQRRALYTKYLRGRGTFISLKLLPALLATHEAAAAPGDQERFYREGRIREDARQLWEALEKHGLLATLELRHACKMETTAGNSRFKRAMRQLQTMLIVFHSGAEQETDSWASNRYELTRRAFPRETQAARRLTAEEARAMVAAKYMEWHPSANAEQLARLFGWQRADAVAAIGAAHLKSRS